MVVGAQPEQSYAVVAGTRPEAIKLSPLILELRARGAEVTLISTGQHRELLHRAFDVFGLKPDHDLGVMRTVQTPADLLGRLTPQLAETLSGLAPDAVIVQGDTATCLAGALAAAYARLPLVHIEAGLRTGNSEPFPEEMHRKLVAQIACLHCAPTSAAATALRSEGIAASAIHVTGNTGIDALLHVHRRLSGDAALTKTIAARFAAIDGSRPLILATVHRRENHGHRLASIAAALADLANDADIVVPVHPHPAVAVALRSRLTGVAGVHLLPPLDYPAFVWLLGQATLVLTDSGGVQEEAPALGVPVFVLRDVTERAEGVDTGNARLIGTDRTAITRTVRALLNDHAVFGRMAEPALPYGTGDAASRITNILGQAFGRAKVLAGDNKAGRLSLRSA